MHPDQDDAKVVVCSQWVETLRFLAEHLADLKPLLYYGGLGDRKREEILNSFMGDGRLLLLSTKAGSRGLNLQHANYVFHFDGCWNPVPEMQAEDRCWRMGQRKTVFVYRYIAKGTIEERIHKVICEKRQLFVDIVESLAGDTANDTDEAVSQNWSLEDLKKLLRPGHGVGQPATSSS